MNDTHVDGNQPVADSADPGGVRTVNVPSRDPHSSISGSPLTALRQQAEQLLRDRTKDADAWDTFAFAAPGLIEDLLAELSRQAEEAAGSEEAFRIQGQELLHHIRECERLTAELARLQGGGYVQHLPTCELIHPPYVTRDAEGRTVGWKTWTGTPIPASCTCGLSALIDPSRGEPTDQP